MLQGMIQREPVIPGHYRLSDESWAEITEAFKNGATARELAVKWRVSMGSVYGHARKAGVGKKTTGNERALEHARAVEAREATRGPIEWETQRQQTAALFSDVGPDEVGDVDPADAAELARKATVASGRAMRKGMWNESRALASLAESYARLADRMGGTNISPDKLPLETLLGVLENRDGVITRRINFDPLGPYDAETEMKKQHIRHKVQSYREAGYPEIVVEAIVRDMMDAGPPQPTPWPPGALK